jgi:hypothetical protein
LQNSKIVIIINSLQVMRDWEKRWSMGEENRRDGNMNNQQDTFPGRRRRVGEKRGGATLLNCC